mgnify:CR=1 FL=1
MGKIKIKPKIVANQPGITSSEIPKKRTKGLEIQAETDPVIEKTIRIKIN